MFDIYLYNYLYIYVIIKYHFLIYMCHLTSPFIRRHSQGLPGTESD